MIGKSRWLPKPQESAGFAATARLEASNVAQESFY